MSLLWNIIVLLKRFIATPITFILCSASTINLKTKQAEQIFFVLIKYACILPPVFAPIRMYSKEIPSKIPELFANHSPQWSDVGYFQYVSDAYYLAQEKKFNFLQ